MTKIDNYSHSQLVPLPRITEALLDRIEQHLDVKFKQTGDLKQAHEQALKFRKVTERDLFHPDVIAQYSELFPYNWRI